MSMKRIVVEGLGKRYQIGADPMLQGSTLYEAVANLPRTLTSARGRNAAGAAADEFWALKDCSFSISSGEAVGIIGHNGAGKSTLLKMLSRITPPSAGRIELYGRLTSLLEVGTGFHPELTGKENIYLNGTILGMTRQEIDRQMDAIVAYSGIEKFLATPLKRLSTGMHLRLAFAVAAHLETEVLVVDEVLAVGDLEFQRKSIGAMKERVARSNTVLFVAHNLNLIQDLCSRCLLFKEGRLIEDGLPADVISRYMKDHAAQKDLRRAPQSSGNPTIVQAEIVEQMQDQSAIHVKVEIASAKSVRVCLNLRVLDALGSPLGFASLGTFDERNMIDLVPGMQSIRLSMEVESLALGNYGLCLDLTILGVAHLDRVEQPLLFTVDRSPKGNDRLVLDQAWRVGLVRLRAERL